MDDLISRQAAIDGKISIQRSDGLEIYSDEAVPVEYLKSLPSAQPEQRWIPCSERLPEDDDWQIVTILDEHGDTPYRYSDFGWYLDKAECWIIDAEQRTDVIAWCELPEPYKERREE